jgi:PPOX class probable F420-dependent enzyme
MSAYTDDQLAYLNDHTQAVLATGRRDGSPQLSTVVYGIDGDRIIVSAKSYTAKWKNALRQPKVALIIGDGREQLTVYGTAEGLDADPERAELTAKVFEAMSGAAVEPHTIVEMLDDQQRTVLAITADKVLYNE